MVWSHITVLVESRTLGHSLLMTFGVEKADAWNTTLVQIWLAINP